MIDFQSKVLSAADNEILENEHRARHQDGSWRVLHTYERPFLRNADGSLKQKIGVAIDITKRKQAEKALEEAYAELEDRVRERTAELECSNTRLQIEIEERKKMEETLRESEERFRAIGEMVPFGFWITDPDGHILFISTSYLATLGMSLELYDTEIAARLHPDDAARAQEIWLRSLETGEEIRQEYRIRGADEQYRWVLARGNCMYDRTGRSIGWAGVNIDITERKQAEEALRESEERFRLLTENALDIVVVLDPEGHILFASPSVRQVGGYIPEDLIGRSGLDLVHPDDLPSVMDALRTASARPKERVSLEVRIRHASGDWLYLDVIGVNLTEEPAVRGFVVNGRNITARKRAEEALRESEGRERRRAAELQAIMEAVPAAVFIAVDPECRIMLGSRRTYDLLRLPQGSNISKSGPEGERPTHFRVMQGGVEVPPEELPVQKAAATGRTAELAELDLTFDDGTMHRLLGNAVPLSDENGRPYGAVGAYIDITERRRAEESLRRRTDDLIRLNEEVEAARNEANMYLDIMTHDVRNANNVSGMYADLLVELLAGDQWLYARKLRDAIQRSTEILRNVATIRRLQEESNCLVPVNLDAVIREEIENFPGASIRYDSLPVEVLGDGLLPVIFTNLIGNAVKFGGPDVEIAILIEERDRDVLVSVEDNGPGVPDEVKAKLFHRFERGVARGKGEGLGLFIVRTLVKRYGGKVWVDDRVLGRPDEGAAFKFTLQKADHV